MVFPIYISNSITFDRCSLIVAAFCLMAFLLPIEAIAQSRGNNFSGLTTEQKKLANKMLAFVDEMESKIIDLSKRLNGHAIIEERLLEYDAVDYIVKVTRGDVLEKAGWLTGITKDDRPPFVKDPVWNRYLSINLHPKTPLVGMLHMTLSFQFTEDASAVGGWMDIIPAVRIEEDLNLIRSRVDDIFDRHDVDVIPYRKAACEGSPREDKRWRRKPACSGVTFYAGKPWEINAENFTIVTETYRTIFDSYVEILNKRMNEDYTESDLEAQETMRRRWLEDMLFSDPFAKNITPYEVWSFGNQAPIIKF